MIRCIDAPCSWLTKNIFETVNNLDDFFSSSASLFYKHFEFMQKRKIRNLLPNYKNLATICCINAYETVRLCFDCKFEYYTDMLHLLYVWNLNAIFISFGLICFAQCKLLFFSPISVPFVHFIFRFIIISIHYFWRET